MKKSDIQLAKLIVSEIIKLQSEPSPINSKALVNYYPFKRIKINKYRVVYRYDDEILYITIIEKRDTVYKLLNKLLQT